MTMGTYCTYIFMPVALYLEYDQSKDQLHKRAFYTNMQGVHNYIDCNKEECGIQHYSAGLVTI